MNFASRITTYCNSNLANHHFSCVNFNRIGIKSKLFIEKTKVIKKG